MAAASDCPNGTVIQPNPSASMPLYHHSDLQISAFVGPLSVDLSPFCMPFVKSGKLQGTSLTHGKATSPAKQYAAGQLLTHLPTAMCRRALLQGQQSKEPWDQG
jgi:hypothetical protein